MASLDAFYTPPEVANSLVRFSEQGAPRAILDPAAGDGALLRAARLRWPESVMVALDCDEHQVRGLRDRDGWQCGRCDFLNPRSRRSSRVLRRIHHQTDLILLNPPYSSRGNSRSLTALRGHPVWSGRAMAFVLTALEAVSEGGEIVALLPSSSLTSQRDAESWEIISKFFSINVVASFPRGTFPLGTASTVAVRIAKTDGGASQAHVSPPVKRSCPPQSANLFRGVVQVHEARKRGLSGTGTDDGRVPFIHSTDLIRGVVSREAWTLSVRSFHFRKFGPSVLISRVGKPLPEKIGVWPGGPAVLSDCVFAIETGDLDVTLTIRDSMVRNFDLVARSYCGSCAQYLTIASLVSLLADLGVSADWSGPSRWLSPSPRWLS